MFKSLEALKQEFGIAPSSSDDDLTAELKRRRAAIHPDRSGGEFLSEAAKAQFARIGEALKYIEDTTSTQLVLSDDANLPSIAATVAKLETALEQMRLTRAPEKQAKEILRRDIRRFGRTSQLTSGTCATIFAALLGFSSKVAENQVLAPLANTGAGRAVVQALLGISAITFVLTWVNEFRLKKMLMFLTSDEGLSAILFWRVNDGRDDKPNTEILKSQIVHDIQEMGSPWHPLYRLGPSRWLRKLLRVRIPNDFASHAADSFISELLERGVIFKKGIRGVQTVYGIERLRAQEVLEDRHDFSHPLFWSF
jgi:hypothetical protein